MQAGSRASRRADGFDGITSPNQNTRPSQLGSDAVKESSPWAWWKVIVVSLSTFIAVALVIIILLLVQNDDSGSSNPPAAPSSLPSQSPNATTTPTQTRTPTSSQTPSNSGSNTPSNSVTPSITPTQSPTPSQTPFKLDLSDLDGVRGLSFSFPSSGNATAPTGTSNANVYADINNDGVSDIVIVSPEQEVNGSDKTGDVRVVFGSAATPVNNLNNLNGINGFTLVGLPPAGKTGSSVSAAGDINNDGFVDIVIGAPQADLVSNETTISAAGFVFVIFGRAAFNATMDVNDLDGTNGFTFKGQMQNSLTGHAVTNGGDINNDGFDDIVIGAPRQEACFVVFGGAGPFPAVITPESLDGTVGFTLQSSNSDDFTGAGVALGDLNNDGIADLAVGSPESGFNGTSLVGTVSVVFGRGSFAAVESLQGLDGTTGVLFPAAVRSSQTGESVALGGDFNGDGITDLIVGAPNAPVDGLSGAGQAVVVFGKSSFDAVVPLATLGADGVVINGAESRGKFGFSVAFVDLNGDGVDDVAVGAPQTDPDDSRQAGETFVVLGSNSHNSTFSVAELARDAVRVFFGSDSDLETGHLIQRAGDFNSDGLDDLLIFAADDVDDDRAWLVYGL